jgi:hypothetical protein
VGDIYSVDTLGKRMTQLFESRNIRGKIVIIRYFERQDGRDCRSWNRSPKIRGPPALSFCRPLSPQLGTGNLTEGQ